MTKIAFILGREPRLSMAEIQALLPRAIPEEWNDAFALFHFVKPKPDFKSFHRLGGTIKAVMILAATSAEALPTDLAALIVRQSRGLHSKIVYGVSIYGWPEPHLHTMLMEIKKEHYKKGVKSRFINKSNVNISSAQYWHLLKDGKEFVVFRSGGKFYLGEVVYVQDIGRYSQRDYGKPFRDMRMGMLPPKLAQILINLSGAQAGQTVWDPFCGSGTILAEGALMGLRMMGSDINGQYLAGATQNIDWLRLHFSPPFTPFLFQHDATQPLGQRVDCDAVVFEGDLGPPLSSSSRPDQLEKTICRLNELYIRFFVQCKKELRKGTIIVGALPFFMLDRREVFLQSTLEALPKHGVKNDPFAVGDQLCDCLTYRRPDQAVGRAIYRFRIA